MLSEKNLENLLFRISKIKVDNLKIGMQTNATLANINKIKILNNYNVNIGVSVDGNEKANKYRVDLKGNSAHERIVKGIELIKKEANYFIRLPNENSKKSFICPFMLDKIQKSI